MNHINKFLKQVSDFVTKISVYFSGKMSSIDKYPLLLWLIKQFRLFSKFGIIGLLAAGLDILIFNILVGLLSVPSLESKIFSGLVSTLFAWAGNRYWTFRKFRRSQRLSEALEYFLVAAGGLLISVACIWVSHYLLGFTSLVADNISGNVIGLILATAFRFFGNQYWVFSNKRIHVKQDKIAKPGL